MDLTPTTDLPIQDPRLDSYLAQCYLPSHSHNNIIELILLHLAPTVPHRLGSRINLSLRLLHSHRIDRRTCPPDLLDPSPLALEEVVDRGIIGKLLVSPTPMPAED